MFSKIVIFIIMSVVGLVIIKYTEPLVGIVGKNSLAEKYLGYGGTYTFWKILAIMIIIVGFLHMIGVIEFGEWGKVNLDTTSDNTITIGQ